MCDFSHLHCHTSYSLLDGAARIQTLLKRAAEMDLMAVGITDHGNLFGVPEFYTSAQRLGVQPVLGCEFYIAPDMHERGDRTRYHQVLWAKNEEGYRNLIKLSSLSYTDGYYYKPRIDRAALKKYGQGLVATTCCLQGEVLQTILKKGEEAARKVFEAYLDIFGDDYYIEIQDHGIPDQKTCNAVLLRWAKAYNVKVVATNDVHYVEQADAAAQDVLLCLQTGKDLFDPNRMRFENDQFYLKSASEMQTALAVDIDDAQLIQQSLVTSCEIAEKCKFELSMGKLLMPHFPIPPEFGNDIDGYLRHLVFERARPRYPEMAQDVVDRLNYELEVIKAMGYAGYFLIVQDFTTAARELGVSVGPGRGSAAGSAVAYCLGITNIDPLAYDLLFERFLNPERVSMPDIDIDFDDRGRARVIDYVVQKYGRENVCQIITFGTMGARSVIRDVSRVLGIPLAEADRIAKLIPEGPKVNLQSAMNEVPEFRALKQDENTQVRKLMHYAEVLEGSARHTGVHAAGVIIAPGDVSNYVPVAVAKSKGDEVITTQYDGSWVEAFGLLKMDFLGLKTLTVLKDALHLIKENHGQEIDLDAIPLDDTRTFELFQRGETVAIFQFESEGMREWMRKLKPTGIDDLIAMNALYRPGPMDLIPNYIARKHGKEKVEFPHPILEPVLKTTYGIPVYQEQVMQMAQVMGGYTLGAADLLRRAMGKKKAEEMEKQRTIFIDGARDKGVDEKTASDVFDMMEKFAGYGFNKCVVGDTSVIDAKTGHRTTVETLFKSKQPFTIHALGEDLRLRPRPVTEVVWNGRKPVFEVRTALGKCIVATGNHPFRSLDGWTNLENLREGDRIAAPRRLQIESDATWPAHELIALAGLLAEGTTCHPTCLYFYRNERALVEDFTTNLELFPDTVARVTARQDGRRLEVSVSTGRDTRFGSIPPWNKRGVKVKAPARSGAFRWAEQLGILGKKATEKVVPPVLFRLCDEDIALFLGRLWSGDGFIANATQHAPYYATSSEQMARDVQTLLLRLGILSTIHVKSFRYRGSHRPGWTVHLLGQGSLPGFLERLGPHIVGRDEQMGQLRRHVEHTERGLTSKDTIPADVRAWVDAERRTAGLTWKAVEARSGVSAKEFYGSGSSKKRGFRRGTIARLATFFAAERLRALAASDIYWDTVVSITPRGLEDTYDLTVEDDHNFVADGLIVHNSHSAAYSIVAYQTAYLKANYPAEFMAAAMTNEMGDTKKLSVVLDEARKLDLELLPPSINHSQAHFTVERGKIRFGLGAIKGVGLGAIEEIIRMREKHGPAQTLFGLSKELDMRIVGKKALECLASAGALDDLEGHRAQFVEAVDAAAQYAQKVQADRAAGQSSLFGAEGTTGPAMEPNLPIVEPWPKARLLKEERELIGVYVSGHPLDAYRPVARGFATAQLNQTDLFTQDDDEDVNVGGDGYGRQKPVHTFCVIITEVQRRTTRTGKPIAFATVEDFAGQGEVVCFSTILDQVFPYLKVDEVVLVQGEVEVRGGSIKIIARKIIPMWKVQDSVQSMVLRIEPEQIEMDAVQRLRDLCEAHRGRCRLYFDVLAPELPEGKQRIRSRTFVIDPSPELMQGITRLFGRDNVLLEGEV